LSNWLDWEKLQKIEAWISEIGQQKRRQRNMHEWANRRRKVIDREKGKRDSEVASSVDMPKIQPRCGEEDGIKRR
jgi:hypothetical protein